MKKSSGRPYDREHAARYDASAQRTMSIRRRTIAQLGLAFGDCVLDVGCGTGLSFPLLLEPIGQEGLLIGLEPIPDMMALTRQRSASAGWNNVMLIEARAEEVELPRRVDALLFNYTHDVIRSRVALGNLFRQSRVGAKVAVAGIKHPPRWLDPFRLYRRFKSRDCHRTNEGLDAPWGHLLEWIPDMQVEPTLWGTGFVAWGHHGPPR
jgi:demethylmenaquinone methyltransferase/2-methoxy-6-polyprenyl-1,4-benzoquinol methylase